MDRLLELQQHLAAMGRLLVGYSGGVDSSLLAVSARHAVGRGGMLAVIGISAAYPESQREQARRTAREHDVPIREVNTGELDDPDYRANAPNRCYFCKRELWTTLTGLAQREGFDTVIDGTNADDLAGHRPGHRAAAETAVRSPLVELGWSKLEVRSAARALGIAIWDAPAAPCLSSRIRYGVEVTESRLAQVDSAEAFLRSIGVTGNLRVRHLGEAARVEVDPEWIAPLADRWASLEPKLLALGFAEAQLDRSGYRSGAMLSILGAGS